MSLLFASQNQGKIKEVKILLSDEDILTPDEVGLSSLDVNETGQTFAENALLKAREFALKAKIPAFADDSGLEVAALNGFPGVHSARWFNGTDAERNEALLAKLKGQKNRQAQFRTVICLFDPQTNQEKYFEGSVSGTLAEEQHTGTGFGYDPLFIPNGYDKPFAELGMEIKNKLSHRAQAIIKLKEYLQSCHMNPPPLS